MAVYLLHFDAPYKHAAHYMGFADDVEARLKLHKQGRGARLMAVIREAGIGFCLARLWKDADRKEERRLKRCKGAPRYCPICRKARRKTP